MWTHESKFELFDIKNKEYEEKAERKTEWWMWGSNN